MITAWLTAHVPRILAPGPTLPSVCVCLLTGRFSAPQQHTLAVRIAHGFWPPPAAEERQYIAAQRVALSVVEHLLDGMCLEHWESLRICAGQTPHLDYCAQKPAGTTGSRNAPVWKFTAMLTL